MPVLTPIDRAEVIALFRHQIIAPLTLSNLPHGELRDRMIQLSRERVRLPAADATRTFSVTTIERWYYAFRAGGLEALKPSSRSDRGRGRHLSTSVRELLLDIRRENPTASAALILALSSPTDDWPRMRSPPSLSADSIATTGSTAPH